MKFFASSVLILLGSITLLSAFPTPENVARLARAGGLNVPEGLSYEEIIRHVQHSKTKRLLINPLTDPVEGKSISVEKGVY